MYKDWNLSLLMDKTGYIENSNEYTNKSMGKMKFSVSKYQKSIQNCISIYASETILKITNI